MSAFELALLGADDPLGEAILKLLDERAVPVGRLHPLTLNDPDSTVAFQGQDCPCVAADRFDFNQAQALVVASRSPAVDRVLARARAQRPAMPILAPDGIVPAPALAVARVLKPVSAQARLLAAHAFVALPVALAGKAGVDELADQSRRLFAMESPEPEVFPLQMAFNLMPVAEWAGGGAYEAQLTQAGRRLAGEPRVGYSVVLAPLFFGAAIALHATTESAVDVSALRAALGHLDGVTLMETDLAGGTPTPATDAAESEAVFVGRVQADEDQLRFWLVIDPMRLEAAQAVEVVENWIDKPANSMLT